MAANQRLLSTISDKDELIGKLSNINPPTKKTCTKDISFSKTGKRSQERKSEEAKSSIRRVENEESIEKTGGAGDQLVDCFRL